MVMTTGSFLAILFLGTIFFIITLELYFCFAFRLKYMRYNICRSQVETHTTGGNPSNEISSNPSNIVSDVSLEDSELNINSILECWIDEIDGSTIYARGRDINKFGPEISFELDIKNVKENDKEFIKEGSVFIVKIEEGNLDINFQRHIKEKESYSNESYIKNRLAIIEGSNND